MTERTLQDATILDEVWYEAMRLSAQIARENGYQQGLFAGRAEEHEKWNRIIGAYAEVIKQPTRDVRDELRDDACGAECGRCSRCVRAASVARHGGDFPGREQVAS